MASDAAMYRNRARAESFGSVAAQYDRSRPPYPDPLILDVAARGARDVLDVGCGTGKASRLLAARGLRVLGVEMDAAMANVARRHGIDVEVSTFEAWDEGGRSFDLITSAQAWHWVDPVEGARKAVRLLRPGGTLALFWNMHELDPAVRQAMDMVYDREAPQLVESARQHGGRQSHRDAHVTSVGAAGFTDVVLRDYPWEHVYARDEWLDLLPTYSDHHLLPGDQLARLLAGVGEVIDGAGGAITAHYSTHAILARAPG